MQSKYLRNYQQKDTFYKSQKWIRLRESILRRDNYCDKVLSRYGKIKPAEVVHHIIPREHCPMYEYEPWNLISVSRKTHNELHDRTGHELSAKGLELLKRTCRKQNIPIPAEFEIEKIKNKFERTGRYY